MAESLWVIPFGKHRGDPIEDALKTWGRRWADDIKASPHRGEIKKAYLKRMEELSSDL